GISQRCGGAQEKIRPVTRQRRGVSVQAARFTMLAECLETERQLRVESLRLLVDFANTTFPHVATLRKSARKGQPDSAAAPRPDGLPEPPLARLHESAIQGNFTAANTSAASHTARREPAGTSAWGPAPRPLGSFDRLQDATAEAAPIAARARRLRVAYLEPAVAGWAFSLARLGQLCLTRAELAFTALVATLRGRLAARAGLFVLDVLVVAGRPDLHAQRAVGGLERAAAETVTSVRCAL